MKSKSDNFRLATSLLDVGDVPLSFSSMAEDLEVTFYPPHERSDLLDDFTSRLGEALASLGAKVIPYDDAVIPGSNGKIKPGIVVIEQGRGEDEDLAMLHLTSLHENPLVLLQEKPCPVPKDEKISSQVRLDTIMDILTYNLTHIPIFVGQNSWVACSATGSLTEFKRGNSFKEDVREYFVPKVSAQVVPPKKYGINFHEDGLNISEEDYQYFIDDFISSANVWKESGLMLAHTDLDDLSYRGRLHERLSRLYVNQRSGMSYGFVSRQLPVSVEPAVRSGESAIADQDWGSEPTRIVDDELYARVFAAEEEWIVKVPDVWVLATRSGCEKTNLNPECDLVRMGLCKRQILFDIPTGVDKTDIQPSYDTLAILSHAVGNAIAASILLTVNDEALFPKELAHTGASISHWHGYPENGEKPEGYFTHGQDNPPVSCSTPQSAVYALVGKLNAMDESIKQGEMYRGDVHIEPYHGTNITGYMSLFESAKWVDRMSS
jgi:hypothetical protein